jgi:ABC-type Na+ efflux pump permease subunit
MFKIVTNKYFDYFIILVIVLSAVQLALDSPMGNPQSIMKKTLFWIDVTTTVIFILEALMKNLTYGFLMNG